MRRAAPGAFALDAGTRALYTTDASNYRRAPDAVLVPRHTDDLLAAVDACHRHGVPLVTRGGGTSVAGNAFGGGLLVDTSRHLTGIGEVDPGRRTVTVQPGVVLDDLRAAAAPYGLTFGPDPSTHGRCTLGGMIGNNACGSHSVAWGTTADNVESLDVLLPDGTRTTVGATSGDELERLANRPDRVGRLYAGLRDLTGRHRAALRTQLPTLARRVSGYALDQLLPENGTQVARALTGSEGSCAVVLGATLKLVEAPAARALVVLAYPDAPAAGDAVPALLAHHPLTVEGLDRGLVRAWQSRQPSKAAVRLPDGGAWLLVETGGADAAEAAAHARALVTALDGGHRPLSARIVTEPAEQRLLWRIREEGAGVATRVPSATPGGATAEAWPGLEDAAVPPERLGDYLRDFQKLMSDHGRQGLVYGHYGEGCLHVRLDFDLLTDSGTRKFRGFMEESAELIAAYGGSLSGEHGDGQSRSELLPRMFGPEVCDAFTEFKELWDPRGLMNPGVIVRPARIDADLRPARVTSPPGGVLPVFEYEDDEGDFARAVRRCVGVGKCRQEESPGVMCPSFRATREERHSTRGRAHLLSEMIDGELLTDGWRSEEVREALDLCLSCKGCKSDCPVGVDMATYKAEFLHHHYAGRRRPASHYSMGRLPQWLRLLARTRTAPLVNLLARVRPLAALGKRLGGIAPERDLPVLPPRPFTRERRREDAPPGPERPAVMLWPDTFSNHLSPRVLHAAAGVLEDAGFRVLLPEDEVCCGLTWISTGQLDAARRVLERAVRTLAPAVRAGIPVVGLEPSCTAALRSDLTELLPGEEAERTAAAVHTFAEFLEAFAPHWDPPEVARPALTQVHCHQHAVTGTAPDTSLHDRMGLRQERLPSGCCGLAGNFGFEKGHYELSQAIGEQALLPAVRAAADDTLVLADGFSCRTQIEQGTGRGAQHLAEVLWEGVRARRAGSGEGRQS
ncbi:FAD-binding and (Fe-S)-binding domain-containing protein [Streptomyces sp. B-S-A8]|uniref:FAD-binding and (Fe-S)-binding domain-containing protein n=1 Tax=Streptomyces solicavernae TaxID=3043614 RepID=A0ABT6RZG9_9ACTN|nr:FAD-binding and (Fe-S)-binding domain-containing protein [Streptomyces sp. B-S-A8]MDI3389837.1 FAD-binding and (Fe-S)-binding domain-containing protein [Streptomyces sp. B-S-A8]